MTGHDALPPGGRRPVAPVIVRRRRIAGASTGAAVATVLWVLGGFPLVGTAETPAAAGSHHVSWVVRPGDTLWGIAEAVHPGSDPRPYVDAMASSTGGSPLQVGQVVDVP